jgi:hypothetical protein
MNKNCSNALAPTKYFLLLPLALKSPSGNATFKVLIYLIASRLEIISHKQRNKVQQTYENEERNSYKEISHTTGSENIRTQKRIPTANETNKHIQNHTVQQVAK